MAKSEWKAAIRAGARAEAREAAVEYLRIREEDPENGGRQAQQTFPLAGLSNFANWRAEMMCNKQKRGLRTHLEGQHRQPPTLQQNQTG